MLDKLTKDSKKLLSLFYKSYLEKRDSGISKFDAKKFNSLQILHDELVASWNIEDTKETCHELRRSDCVNFKDFIDGSILEITLSDEAIVYMENRFKSGVKDVLGYITSII